MQEEYPILEYDHESEAVIKPQNVVTPADVPEHCVLCFFQDVIRGMSKRGYLREITELSSEVGPHPVYEMVFREQPVALCHPGVGAPLAAAMLEELIALGCRKFIVCGGAGVLDRDIPLGHLIIPRSAVRDEGTSYHYLPPAREVEANPEGVDAIEKILRDHKTDYLVAKTWTTDGPYRETTGKVQRRKKEGCVAVEMEAAALFAVAKFRNVVLAQVLYAGDVVNGGKWDPRGWDKQTKIREKLCWLAAEACLVISKGRSV